MTSRSVRHDPGFTMIETLVALMVLSIAVVSLCELIGAGMTAAATASEMTTAVNLAGTIREIAVTLPTGIRSKPIIGRFGSVLDLDGQRFSPPIDGSQVTIAGMEQWSQDVAVQPVDDQTGGRMARMSVTVRHDGRAVYTGSWLVAAEKPE